MELVLSAEQKRDKYGRIEGHSVIDGVLRGCSPSQVRNFDHEVGGCQRQWWYDKVAHFARRAFKSQELGKLIHAQIEHYLETGENVLGPIPLVGIQHLPPPKSKIKIEWPIHWLPTNPSALDAELAKQPKLSVAGIPMIGFMDLLDLNLFPHVVVADHKTISSIDRYGKTPKELLKDPQAVTYLYWALLAFPQAQTFEFKHIYYQTHGARRSEVVPAMFSRADLLARFAKLTQTVEAMKVCAKVKDPTAVPHNPEACGAYGGCSFSSVCPNSPGRSDFMGLLQGLSGKVDTSATPAPGPGLPGGAIPAKNSIVGRQYLIGGVLHTYNGWTGVSGLFCNETTKALAKIVGDAPVFPVENAPVASPAPVAAPQAPAPVVPAPVAPIVAPAPAQAAAAPAPAGLVVGQAYLVEGKVLKFQMGMTGFHIFLDAAGVPVTLPATTPVAPIVPGVPAPFPPPVEPVTHTATTAAGSKLGITDIPEGVVPPDAPAGPPAPSATPAAPPPAEKPKRTRRTKEQIAADEAVAAAQAAPAVATPAPAVTPVSSSAAPVAPPIGAKAPPPVELPFEGSDLPGLRLYYQCVPNVPYRDLSAYVQDLATQLAKSASVSDIRMADGPLGYGKWAGYLAALAKENPPVGDCVIWRSDMGDHVFNALASVAALVVRGR